MNGHEMTAALAGRMAVWTILALLAMAGVAVVIGRWLQRVGYSYPEPTEPEDVDFPVRTSTEWQERARRAEALGFMDDEPKRTA